MMEFFLNKNKNQVCTKSTPKKLNEDETEQSNLIKLSQFQKREGESYEVEVFCSIKNYSGNELSLFSEGIP